VAAIANTTCIACAEGKYSEAYANSNATGCVDCAAGRYGDVLGAGRAELCEACGPARYSNTLDGTPPGNANPRAPGEGWKKCEFCPPSQTPNADQTVCINAFCSEFIKGEPGFFCPFIEGCARCSCILLLLPRMMGEAKFPGRASVDACLPCPAGSVAIYGITCTNCSEPGKVQDDKQATCRYVGSRIRHPQSPVHSTPSEASPVEMDVAFETDRP
jgi:hypothetical protein